MSDFILGKIMGQQEQRTYNNISEIIDRSKKNKKDNKVVSSLKQEINNLIVAKDSAKALEQVRVRQLQIMKALLKEANPDGADEEIKKINKKANDYYKEELIKINPDYKNLL